MVEGAVARVSAGAITERKMFGGLCLLEHGNMIAGIMGDDLLVRVGAEHKAAALTRPDAGLIDTLPSLAGAVAGSAALLALVRAPFSDAAPRSAPGGGQ